MPGVSRGLAGTTIDEASGLDRGERERGRLTCALDQRPPHALVRLTGELDFATALGVRTVLHKALAGQPATIVVDLSGVSVEDDVVLTVFSAFARGAADWPGCPVILCGPSPPLRAALDRMAVTMFAPVHPDLAAALVAAGARPAPLRYRQRLPASPAAAAVARQLVAAACRAWQLRALAEDAELVVSELVSNAVRHTAGEIELAIVLHEHFLHLAVHDSSADPPRMTSPDPDSGEGGRGLLLVDAVTAGWGSTPTAAGKHVWATLRRPR